MLNSISFGWIDYSAEDRNKVMSVLHALEAPEAVDELGIGVVRDGFADILFPGTSTVQTRAKYFMIVPYILMELEKEKNLTKDKFLNKLESYEKDLIKVLDKDNADGVIGRRAKNNLKRKPSSIYWNGLRKLGIFKYPKLTIDSYAKAIQALKLSGVDVKRGRANEEEAFDDDDAANGELIGEFWRCIPPDKNWRDEVTIDLTKTEAEYLKNRISKSPFTRDTLFGYIVSKNILNITEIDSFDNIGNVMDLPENIKLDYEMAKDFSDFIYGANIRYNCILYKYDNENLNSEWKAWENSSFVKNKFENYNVNGLITRLNIRDSKLINFLNTWHKLYLSKNLDAIDELIIKREESIKTKGRCKLNNPENFNTNGNRTRGGKLEYRFSISKKLICDIFNGLEEEKND